MFIQKKFFFSFKLLLFPSHHRHLYMEAFKNVGVCNNADSELILELFHFKKKIKRRPEWSGKLDFFLAALGYASNLFS